MYRLGRKQRRAILDKDGNTVGLFHKTKESLAKTTVRLLNKEETKLYKDNSCTDLGKEIHEEFLSFIETFYNKWRDKDVDMNELKLLMYETLNILTITELLRK